MFSSSLRVVATGLGTGLTLLLFTGCQALTGRDTVSGPSYQPSNVAASAPRLPADLKRVAVLPLAVSVKRQAFEHGCTTLEPILQAELLKVGRFECVWVPREQASRLTGQPRWRAAEALPAGFFDKIRDETGCDAVLFSELTEYRPYPPQAMGWRFRLVEGTRLETLWTVDEVFDAGENSVINAARRYQMAHEELAPALQDSRAMLNSPRRFGQYTLATLLATLPEPPGSAPNLTGPTDAK